VATAVYQTIRPSVVYITAERAGGGPEDSMSGAGVVISAQGQILTARHVVTGAQAIQITYADGSQGTAQIASEQADQDIAVLAPDAPPALIVPAVLGGGVQVGDDVYAVGHPLGLADSLTAGVVSGLNRTIPVEGGVALNGLIQFDAAVNPGNSGGPLLNRAGQVVGIVTALANPSQQPFFVGIGFAVPIATAGGAAGAPQQ
jgi:S1-C subfamily serine protease